VDQNQYRKAQNIYETLIKHDPSNAYFLKQLAVCQVNLGKSEKALANFHKANRLNPKDSDINIHIANLYLRSNDLQAALQIINSGLEFDQDLYQLIKARAEILYKMGVYDEAVGQYHRLLAMGDSSGTVYKKLGTSYYFLNRYPDALYSLKKVVEQDTTDDLMYPVQQLSSD